MKRHSWFLSKVLIFLATALLMLHQDLRALDNGVDAYNLRKGDWIYYLSDATNKLGGNVSTVHDIPTLMSYEKGKGMSFLVVKAGQGSTNFPSNSNKQFTSNLVWQAHNVGLKIFGYTRSYGVDIPGEIKIATNVMVLGADGYVQDAEIEWESQNLANNTTLATNLLSGIKAVFPNRFLGHSPAMYISLHSSFPYKQYGLYCDAAMPQDYWKEFGISSTAVVGDMDTEWNNWQDGLSGGWVNAIKPIAPIGEGWNGVTATEITNFYDSLKNDTTPATAIGYQGVSWWRADLHTTGMWTGIGNNSIGVSQTNAPVLSSIATDNLGLNSVDIIWDTDQSSDSVVDYGPTTSYGTSVTNSILTVYHLVSLSGLTTGATYHYRVKSKNQNGNVATSGDFTFTTTSTVQDIILDNTDATIVGTWSTGTSSTDKYGADYRYKSGGTGTAYFQYIPSITTAGYYKVYEWHPQGSNRTSAGQETVFYNGGNQLFSVNQKTGGGAWNLLGTFNFAAGTGGYVKIADNHPDSAQLIMCDAIKYSYVPVPAAPSGLNVTFLTSSQVNLAWTDNSTNESNFILRRATASGGPYTDIATLPANTTAVSDTGLTPNSSYYYKIRATNIAGQATSPYLKVTTLPLPPAAPSGLSAAAINYAEIDLSWTDNSTNETSFVIARSTTSGGPYTDIGNSGQNITTYADTTVSGSTTYYYVVRAANAGGSSADTAQASATTPQAPPNAPSGLTATASSSSQIDLSWTDNSSDETAFVVGRSTTSGGPYTDIFTNAANVVTFSDTGLGGNTTYYYVVRARNAGGDSDLSNEDTATTPAGAPAAPSGLTATVISSSQINLNWTDNSSDEDNFILARSTTSGGPYTDVATNAANVVTYNDTGLSANTAYYYVVRAVNVGGSSANSAEATGTTLQNPPAAPSGLVATTTSQTRIDLSWTDNSSNETGFRVEHSTDNITFTQFVSLTTNVTSTFDSGLTPATTYYYRVRAYNSGGNSAYSAVASATTLPNAPAAPSGLTATAASQTQINLSWTDNSNNEDSFIVGRSTTSGGPYTDITTTAANAVAFNDTGLTANTTYYYVVRARNTGGDSANSAQASATTLPNAPAAPSGLTATTVSQTQINLSWTDNSNNEDSFIVGRSTTSGGPYTDIATTAANATAYNNTGLTANTTYYYVVRARNTGGDSANSAQASATTLPNAPAAPSGLTATTVSQTQINLSWTDNSNNEDSFIVGRSTTSGGPYTDIVTTAANATTYNNTGLTANTTYYYVVRARNTGGDSANSAQASATTLPNAPAAPSGLTATAVSSSQINLSWTDNSNNENNFIIGRGTTSGGPYTDIATNAANTTTFTNTGLTASTTYYYVVRARNTGGDSANSAQASATTLSNPPAAPSGLTATAVSSSQINLSWTDNSNNENNFIIGRSTTSGGPYTDIATNAANTTTFNNTGLSGSTTYYYVVRARNAGGDSANSAQASATTFPTAPSGLTATAQTSSAIKLVWTDNSSTETAMVVGRATTSGGPYTDVVSLAANTTSWTNSGLTAGTTYYFVVRATNSLGSSPNSNEASAAPPADIIIDNPSATVTGSWSTGTSSTDKFGTDYRYKSQGTGTAYLTFTPNLLVAGNYQVYEWHPQGTNRTTNAPVIVSFSGGSATNFINQKVNGGTWVTVGTAHSFNAGTGGYARISDNFPDAGQNVMADAIKFVKVP